MTKRALVLSGGGALGAFQVTAEKYAREVKGYEWDVIAGVSVGALNGTMVAMKQYQRLEEIWRNITNDQVYTGKMNLWALVRLLFGAKSVHGNKPLWKMIQQEVDPAKIAVDLRIGVVSLRTGEYVRFRPTCENFEKAVLASTAIPVIWAPVDVSDEHTDMVDGGARNVSPLGDVLDTNPDQVVIINCGPREPPKTDKSLRNALEIARVALEVTLHEISTTDVREFVRINRNVEEAEKHGVQLHNEDGKPFKYYDYAIIEPDEPLGDSLDFSKKAIEDRMEAGWEKAKQVLGP